MLLVFLITIQLDWFDSRVCVLKRCFVFFLPFVVCFLRVFLLVLAALWVFVILTETIFSMQRQNWMNILHTQLSTHSLAARYKLSSYAANEQLIRNVNSIHILFQWMTVVALRWNSADFYCLIFFRGHWWFIWKKKSVSQHGLATIFY